MTRAIRNKRIVRTAGKIIGQQQDSLDKLYQYVVLRKVWFIVEHPLHSDFELNPSGWCFYTIKESQFILLTDHLSIAFHHWLINIGQKWHRSLLTLFILQWDHEQKPFVRIIINPCNVYIDPNSQTTSPTHVWFTTVRYPYFFSHGTETFSVSLRKFHCAKRQS